MVNDNNRQRYTEAAWAILEHADVPIPDSGGLLYMQATTDDGVTVLVLAHEDRAVAFDATCAALTDALLQQDSSL